MISYKTLLFKDYIDLFYASIREDIKLESNIFPSHTLFYCRAALEKQFKRKFSLTEVKLIIKDKSWQLESTSPQSSELKGELETPNVS